MNKEKKDLITKLKKLIVIETIKFMKENLRDEEPKNEVFCLVCSSYVSALHAMMNMIADHDKENEKIVESFMSKLINSIKDSSAIAEISIHRYRDN